MIESVESIRLILVTQVKLLIHLAFHQLGYGYLGYDR